MTSHERHGVLNHAKLNCLFSSLRRTSELRITSAWWGNSKNVNSWFTYYMVRTNFAKTGQYFCLESVFLCESDALTSWPLGDVEVILTVWFSNSLHRIAGVLDVKMLSGAYHRTSLEVSIGSGNGSSPSGSNYSTWANVDPDPCYLTAGVTRPQWVNLGNNHHQKNDV